MATFLSTREAGEILGVPTWRIRRLFELRILDEPERLAGKRAIRRDNLPAIEETLRQRGWLPAGEPAGAA